MTDTISSDDVGQPVDPLDGYRSTRRLVLITTIALLVNLVAITSRAIGEIAGWRLTSASLAGRQVSDTEFVQVDRWLEFSNTVVRISYVASAPLFLVTLYILARNAGALRRNSMTAPATAVIWFFVPFLCLFMPYLVVQRIWQASSPGQIPWRENPASPIVRRWWAFWILSTVLGATALRLSSSIESAADYRSAIVISLLASAVKIGLGVTAIIMLRRLSAMQEQRFAMLRSKSETTCPGCGEPILATTAVCPVCGREASRGRQPSEFVRRF